MRIEGSLRGATGYGRGFGMVGMVLVNNRLDRLVFGKTTFCAGQKRERTLNSSIQDVYRK